jgi:hypothetical protein
MLTKIEAKVAPPSRVRLSVMVDDTDDEAERKKKQEKALAEHVARHPEDAGRKVEDFDWVLIDEAERKKKQEKALAAPPSSVMNSRRFM